MTDYAITKLPSGEWSAHLDGAPVGKAGDERGAAAVLGAVITKRLPPYWDVRLFDVGCTGQRLALAFAGSIVVDHDAIGPNPSAAEVVEYAWRDFARSNPGWSWIRAAASAADVSRSGQVDDRATVPHDGGR